MNSDEMPLKPCPFCGSMPEYTHDQHGRSWLRCKRCFIGIDPQWYGGDLGVTEASWNTRADTVPEDKDVADAVERFPLFYAACKSEFPSMFNACETLIRAATAKRDCEQRLSNTEILMFVRGWQGGTVDQIAAELGVTTLDIINADYDRMQDLMRLAQSKRNVAEYRAGKEE